MDSCDVTKDAGVSGGSECITGDGAGGRRFGVAIEGGGETMAAVSAMLCDDDVKAAAQGGGIWGGSSGGFGTGANSEWGVGKAGPKGGYIPLGDGYGI